MEEIIQDMGLNTRLLEKVCCAAELLFAESLLIPYLLGFAHSCVIYNLQSHYFIKKYSLQRTEVFSKVDVFA